MAKLNEEDKQSAGFWVTKEAPIHSDNPIPTAKSPAPDILRCAYMELVVTDLAASRQFYVDVLGLTVTEEDEQAIYLRSLERSWEVMRMQHVPHVIFIKWTEPQHPATRTDGWQQPPRCMADQQENCARWRLFKAFKERIGPCPLHIISRIDDNDTAV